MGRGKGYAESFKFVEYKIYFQGEGFSLAEEAKVQPYKKILKFLSFTLNHTEKQTLNYIY
jgi:hypothetical protein